MFFTFLFRQYLQARQQYTPVYLIGVFIGIILIGGVFLFIPKGQAVSPACEPSAIAENITGAVEKDWTVFARNDQSFNHDAVFTPIESFAQSLQSEFSGYSPSNMLSAYHKKQGKLFELALMQGLQNVSSAQDLVQGASKQNTTIVWNPELTHSEKYPVIALFTQKIPNGAYRDSLLPIVPTLVLGYESTLQFAVFSCVYHQNISETIQNNTSLQGIATELQRVANEQASNLLKAKRVLDLALNAYDSFIIAYPQHISYERTIAKLEKLKSQFSKLEELSASCVYKNHLNPSCK